MDSKTIKSAGCSLLLVAGLAGPVANAVEPTVYELGEGGAIAPHLRLEFGNDNNPLRANEGSQEAAFLRLQPSVSYFARRRNNQLELNYSGNYYQYFEDYCQVQSGVVRPGDCLPLSQSSDIASYQDHELSLNGFLEVTSRLRANVSLSRSIQHQPLGTGLSVNRNILNTIDSPDNWLRTRGFAQLAYGASQARGEFRAGLNFQDRELRSDSNANLDATSETSIAPFAQLFYRVGTRTQLFAGVGFDQVRDGIRFNGAGDVAENLERDITRLSFGAEFADTSVTSGSVSVSAVTENFLEGGTRDDLTFLSWDINLVWRPRTFSTVTFSGGRQTETGVFDDDLSLTTTFGVDWVHFWRERFSTSTGLDFLLNDDLDENIGLSATDDDEDRTVRFSIQGNYNVRRWFDVGGFLLIDSRDGRADVRDFERTVVGITANGTI